MNDVYPVTSWAYIDYHLRPKPAFYTIRRAFAPVSLGIDRTPRTAWVDEDNPELANKQPRFAIFAHNTQPEEIGATLEFRAYDFRAGREVELSPDDAKRDVVLAAGCNNELGEIRSPHVGEEAQLLVVCAKLLSSDGTVLARHVDWPEPYRYLTWPQSTKVSFMLKKSEREQWEQEVRITANQPIKGYWLETTSTKGREPLWEDNMVDLMPGEEMVLGVNGLQDGSLEARFLADWELDAN